MTNKNLNIDIEKLKETLLDKTKFGLDKAPIIKKNKNGSSENIIIVKNGVEAKISIFYKEAGTITFLEIGKHVDLSKSYVKYLIEECKRSDSKNTAITYKEIEPDDFENLLNYLEEDLSIKREGLKPSTKDDLLVRFCIKSIYKDTITLTQYNNKTVLLQGRPLYLFNEIKSFFNQLIEFDQVIEIESGIYSIDLKPEKIREELQSRLFSVYDFIDERIKKIFAPSLSLMKIDIELEDYCCCVSPALRGLEGYIRMLLKTYTRKSRNVGRLGSLFDGANGYEPIKHLKDDINNANICNALKDAYCMYNKHRNSLFHTDKNDPKLTRIIQTKNTADTLINEIFDVINQSFLRIKNEL